MDKLLTLYPQNVTQGSPYDTGTQNAFTPQFKRIASLLGDIVFQAPRRLFLNNLSKKQNTWSFCTLHVFPCLHAQVLVPPLTRRFPHSKQTPEVVAYTRFGPRVRCFQHLRSERADGLPYPLCHEPRSQWRIEPAMAAVYYFVATIADTSRQSSQQHNYNARHLPH